MKFALVDGKKIEATKGAKGLCPSCGSELIAKCGEVYVNHWAHKGKRNCDQWWENETDWHRSWKDKFPIDWQEVVHFDEKSGEKHIADVKTGSGWALEFQHSYLKPEERRARNAFYRKLVWIVDGRRRSTDIEQFLKILEDSPRLPKNGRIIQVHFPDECRLLKEWHDSNALVFFDFQDVKDAEPLPLFFLYPKTPSGDAYLTFCSRVYFIELHNNNKFDELVNNKILPTNKELAIKKQNERINNMRNQQMANMRRRLANMRRRRKRF